MLELRDVAIFSDTSDIITRANLRLEKGRILGLVGASGSGKTLLSQAIMEILPTGIQCRGAVIWKGEAISGASKQTLQNIRGNEIGLVFQNTSAAFDPLITLGDQVAELFMFHQGLRGIAARDAALAVFQRVEWPTDIDPFDRYPHEISGGQRQRALIAMAIALKPDLIIADEPTASLDVTTSRIILDMLKRLVREQGASMLMISHDLPALATCVDDIAHLHAGVIEASVPVRSVVEQTAPAELVDLFRRSLPPRNVMQRHTSSDPDIVTVTGLNVIHRKPRLSLFGAAEPVKAVRNVSLQVKRGECVALVGESGSGKTTLARTLLGIDLRESGTIDVLGQDPSAPQSQTTLWQNIRLMFQDPFSAVDPNWTVQKIIGEALASNAERLGRAERLKRVADAVLQVGLSADLLHRFPHQLSGGQLQRVTLARALITRPEILILDEPISALDADARGQILDLLAHIAMETQLTLIIITHDLGVARAIADRVIVMKDGEIVEEGEIMAVLDHPKHPYTKALVAASPTLALLNLAASDLAARTPQG